MSKTRTAQPPAPQRRVLYILSDSTANLARHMLTAFLTQFPPDAFTLQVRPFLEDPAKLAAALDEVDPAVGIVFHALVSRPAKQLVADRCGEKGVPACDLTGSFVDFLSRESGLAPTEDFRRLHHVNAAYRQRIRAIEFTLQHDDGLGLDTIHQAHIVLAGVSRTSKTPTSIYLAQQGFMVGNVSLAMGIDPPTQLLNLPPRKVVGLLIDPVQLVEIRTRRQREWRMGDTTYNDPDQVERELTWSRRLFARQGWPSLNVTDQAVEETAGRILAILGLTPPSGRA